MLPMGITQATHTDAPSGLLDDEPVKARGRQRTWTASTDEKRERILRAAEALKSA